MAYNSIPGVGLQPKPGARARSLPWPRPGSALDPPGAHGPSKSKLSHASRLELNPQNQWTSKQIHKNPEKSLRSGRSQQVPVESYSTLPQGRCKSNKNPPKTQKVSKSCKHLKHNEKTFKLLHDMAWHSSCMTWHVMTWLNIHMYI